MDYLLNLNDTSCERLKSLNKISAINSMSMTALSDFDVKIDKKLYPKPKKNIWIYGTEQYNKLIESEICELAWIETARDVSMFIWLEQTLPPLYMGYVNKYFSKLDPDILKYLMIFSKEEIVHTLVFKEYMQLAELKIWEPPAYLRDFLLNFLPDQHPAIGIFFTLLLEWVAEAGAMYNVQNDCSIDLVTKKMFTEHHKDESRHIIFGKLISENFFKNANDDEMTQAKKIINEIFPLIVDMYTYNADIIDYCSFCLPINKNDQKMILNIRQSNNNIIINSERFGQIYSWLKKLKLYDK